MSTAEQTAYKASHYRFGIELPDSQGVVNAEYMKLLWENPNTTQSFTEQNVTLASADYDFYLVNAIYSTANSAVASTIIAPKGKNALLSYCLNNAIRSRGVTYVSATSLTIGHGYKDNGTQDDTLCIPIAIYGIKSTIQLKINAIATELSTRADHCFLDDETTTVEEAITYKDVYSTTEHIVGKWIDGNILYEKTIDFGALPNNTSKNKAHGISNISKIIDISGYYTQGTYFRPLPFGSATTSNMLQIYADATNVTILDNSDLSAWNECYVTLRYTKTV